MGVKENAARIRLKKLGIKPKPARKIPKELVEKAFFDDPKLVIAAKRLGLSQPRALFYARKYEIPRTDHRHICKIAREVMRLTAKLNERDGVIVAGMLIKTRPKELK